MESLLLRVGQEGGASEGEGNGGSELGMLFYFAYLWVFFHQMSSFEISKGGEMVEAEPFFLEFCVSGISLNVRSRSFQALQALMLGLRS